MSQIDANGTTTQLLLGIVVVLLAAGLGGTTGFGYGIIGAPLLLAIGLPLPFIVTSNLFISLITRVSVVYRFWSYINLRRALLLIAGSVPGLYAGARVLHQADRGQIKLATGIAVMVATVLLILVLRGASPEPIRGAAAIAGFFGGLLGATTSLNGITPVFLLARERARIETFQGDLALYFVVSNSIALGMLAWQGSFAARAIYPASFIWLPGAVIANWVGATYGTRLPPHLFRTVTLTLAFLAGLITAITA